MKNVVYMRKRQRFVVAVEFDLDEPLSKAKASFVMKTSLVC